MAKRALMWLHAHFVGAVSVSNQVLLEFMCGDQTIVDKHRDAVRFLIARIRF